MEEKRKKEKKNIFIREKKRKEKIGQKLIHSEIFRGKTHILGLQM